MEERTLKQGGRRKEKKYMEEINKDLKMRYVMNWKLKKKKKTKKCMEKAKENLQ